MEGETIDIKKIRMGIEIHQQLDTHKLFCDCPTIPKENVKPDKIIKRNLFAVASELGEIDVAALYEQEKNKNHHYYFYDDCCCLVELDEMPPFPVNEEALEIALQICMLLNAEIVPCVQVMRKIVIDGSDISGFQRTMLLGRNGTLEYEFMGEKKSVKINTICLEEEAAKKIKEEDGNYYWGLDRYGIPLIEITTDSSIKHFEEAKIVALSLGELLRACRVKRGLGTIRQDLNVSVEGGARTEIKGVQEPRLIPIILENEIKSQIEKIKKGEKISPSVKKANEDGSLTFLRPLPTSARMYPETDIPLVNITKEILEKAKKNLPKKISEMRENLMHEIESLDLVNGILKNRNRYDLWIEINKKISLEKEMKKFLAGVIVNDVKGISRELQLDEEEITKNIGDTIFLLLSHLKKEKITKPAFKEILTECIKKNIIKEKNYVEIEKIVEKIIDKFRPMAKEELKKKIFDMLEKEKIDEKYLLQEAIKRFKLNISIKLISESVNEILRKRESKKKE